MACATSVEFQKSYSKSSDYPQNLMPNEILSNQNKLASYKSLLGVVEHDLCLTDKHDNVNDTFEIPVIDIGTADGKGLLRLPLFEEMLIEAARMKRNLHNPGKVTEWLGVDIVQDTVNPIVQQVVARKRDPRCRFMYALALLNEFFTLITQLLLRSELARQIENHQGQSLSDPVISSGHVRVPGLHDGVWGTE